MATGVGPPGVQSDQGTCKLGKDDLKVVIDALVPVAGKYEFFGIQIGVYINEVDEIRRQFADSRQCLLRILRIRLGKTPALTWNDIDTALRSKSVNESGLANDIQKEYGHLFIHEQTFESQEDGRKGSEKKHISTKKGKLKEDGPQQVRKEQETDSDEEVSESQGFKKSSEIPRTDDKSTKTQQKDKKAKKPLEPEKGSERERKQRGVKRKHADISPVCESKVAKNSRERLKGSSQKCKEISEQIAPKEVLMKYESEPSSGKYESKVIHKSKHKRKDSGRSGQKCSEKKQVLLISESISSSEEEIVRSKCESKVIHKSEERLKKSSRKCSEQIAPKEVQSKSESESSASSSEEEMVEEDESETAEEYSSKQEIDSNHGEVRKSDNISTKTEQRVKKAKKHSEPEQGNAKREQIAQMKQQARHEVKIESKVRLKGSHTSMCKEQIAPKEVQSKSESEYSASSSEEEMEVDESETAEEYSSEQEQDSDNEEVSEDPAEQTREGEYPSDSETKVKTKKTKGFVRPGNEMQKYELIDQQSFQMESDKGNQYKRCAEREAQKHKSRKKQRAEGEISCSVQDEIAVSSSHYRGKAGKSQIAEKTNPLKQIQGKEDERRKAKTQIKAKKITEEQYSDEEVREKPTLKPAGRKEHKKLKREDLNEDKHKVARMTQYHKERVSRISDTHTEEKREKDKISTKAIQSSGKTKKGKYHKSDSRQRKDKLATKQRGKGTPSSDVTEEDSEDEEASSKGSDGEVRRRLAGKSKRIKSEDEYSTASASKGGRSLVICHDKAKQSSQKLIEEKESQKVKHKPEKSFPRSTKRDCSKVQKANMKPPTKGKYLKTHSKAQKGSKREVKTAVETSEENLEQESESAESSEGEEKARDSVEEEEAEPSDDESAGATSSEEEVKKASIMKKKGRVKKVAKEPDSPGDGYQSDTGGRDRDQEEHSIKPKKRSRRRHRESSPIARGSSSPSTSQEEQQVQKRKSKRESDRERRKMVVKKKEKRESSSSVTDDSSPESEMLRNLTQSEIKNLVKVFKCFFGRLCCAIKYPVETAAQLQAKRLISCSTMENIITSPESQQVKAITLVRALDRKIKPRPDKIFTVTKVFLENKSLQNVGRQLWTETGILAMNLLQLYDICSLFFSQERFVLTGQPQCLAMSCLLQRDN